MPQASSKQRILFICHDGQPYGAQNSLFVLLQSLAQQNNIECYVSLAKGGPFEDKLNTIGPITVLRHKRLQWIKHKPLNIIERGFLATGLFISAIIRIPQLIQIIKQHNITMVHTNSMVSLEGALAAKLAGIPHIWHIRELILNFNPKFTPILGKHFTLSIINLLSQKVIAISKAVQQQLKSTLPESKIALIHNAVSPLQQPAEPKTLSNPEALRTGYVGRLSPTKGFTTVLNVFAAFHQQHPNSTLHCAGQFIDPEYEQNTMALIKHHGIAEQVIFHGFLNGLDAFYKNIDVLLFPSTHDSFGRSVIEAMQHAVVVVAANANALPEIITHEQNGYLYNPEHAETEIFETLMAIATHPSDYQHCSTNALKTIKNTFSAEAMTQQILRLYKATNP